MTPGLQSLGRVFAQAWEMMRSVSLHLSVCGAVVFCSASVELSRMVGVLALRVVVMELWRRRLCHREDVAAIPPVGSSVDLDDIGSWLIALPSYRS